eukprot:1184808-Prorocentrum_minimum.AAC.2
MLPTSPSSTALSARLLLLADHPSPPAVVSSRGRRGRSEVNGQQVNASRSQRSDRADQSERKPAGL